MKFIDEATIVVQSGHGGRGCVSFRREKFIPRGGPDGGDGGRGGDVEIIATHRKRTLQQFQFQRQFKAPNGTPGEGNQKAGKKGASITIEVPVGTVLHDAETQDFIADLSEDQARLVIAQGGIGGKGNKHFATANHRTPRFAQPGEPGVTRTLKLELKVLADVGIVGLPNAGKSTLITFMSGAQPKIAAYPFTTLSPNLGVVYGPGKNREPAFVMADIPGLIEGAHTGAGLGIRFLKHIERTRVLVHLIDGAAVDPADPLQAYRTINTELAQYNPELPQKPQLVVVNKLDLPGVDVVPGLLREQLGTIPVFGISAHSGEGIAALTRKLIHLLGDLDGDRPQD